MLVKQVVEKNEMREDHMDSHADAGIAKILVWNKVELADDRNTTAEVAKTLAESTRMKYYGESAKENINIDTFMKDLMH